MILIKNKRKPWRAKKCLLMAATEAKKLSPLGIQNVRTYGYRRIVRGWRACQAILTEDVVLSGMTKTCKFDCISNGHELGLRNNNRVQFTCPLRKYGSGEWAYSVYFPLNCGEMYVWRPNKEHTVRSPKKEPIVSPINEQDCGLQ